MMCRLSYPLSNSVVWEPQKFSIIQKNNSSFNLFFKAVPANAAIDRAALRYITKSVSATPGFHVNASNSASSNSSSEVSSFGLT